MSGRVARAAVRVGAGLAAGGAVHAAVNARSVNAAGSVQKEA